MSRLLIINPPDPPGGWYLQKDRAAGLGTALRLRPKADRPPVLAPFDVAQLAGLGLDAGWEVTVFDAVADRHDQASALAALPEPAPDLLAVRLALFSLEEDLAFVRALKARWPATPIVLWGNVIHFTVRDWAERAAADWVCFGDLEAVLWPYLKGETPQGLVPLATIGPDWRARWITQTELAGLPLPAWHLLPLARYAPGGELSRLVLHLQSSRGCSVACSMCPYFVLQGRYRQHDLARLRAELLYLHGLGVRHVQFRDANITERPDLPRALAASLIADPIPLTFTMETALENVPAEDLQLYHRAGLRHLITGIESADPAIMAQINQDPDWIGPIERNLAICRELGIEVTTMYIVGFAHDTWASIGATIALAQRYGTRYSVSVMTPYHGTAYRQQALANGLVDVAAPYRAYTGFDALGGTLHLSRAEVQAAYAWARAELDLASRRRSAPKEPLAQLDHWLRYAAVAALSLPSRWRGRLKARLHRPVPGKAQHVG